MKKIALSFLILLVGSQLFANTERNLLTKETDLIKLKEMLVMDQKWVSYPDYSNRIGWDKLLGENKQKIIESGKEYLKYQWKVVKATDYLEFDRTGNRSIMQSPYFDNQEALSTLVVAELAEGKGQFMDQIINGVFHTCEMTSWVLSAHFYLSEKKVKNPLPDIKENLIDLFASQTGALLSWTHYFFRDDFDKINPLISERLRFEIQKRILDPFQNMNFWWTSLPPIIEGYSHINNWNPWCNANVIQCFMLLENDKEKLAGAVYRSMRSVDKYINADKDGACDEGPGYWGVAGGKMFDYLQLLQSLTGEKISIFSKPEIKSIGEYIYRASAGKGWVVNFSDASAKGGGNANLIYSFGKAVGSEDMMQFAAYLRKLNSDNNILESKDIFRTLRNASSQVGLKNTSPVFTPPIYTWYPKTEYCFMSDKLGNFIAAKGGNNAENHNHNDVGTFIYYSNSLPVIFDAGVGEYTAKTFSPDRYSIWTMQSNYHNLPVINGVGEQAGSQFKAVNSTFNADKMLFSTDIANAYPKNAEVKSWVRSYRLSNGIISIQDQFSLKKAIKPNEINFMTWGNVNIDSPGKVIIKVQNETIELTFDKKYFQAKIDTIKLDEAKLTRVWGKEIYRLSLHAKDLKMSGEYQYRIQKMTDKKLQ